MEAAGHNTPMQIFPVLKTMRVMHLPKLERRAENSAGEINSSITFPQLEKLTISNCDKLSSLPNAPVLTYLRLSNDKVKNSAAGDLIPMPVPLYCLSSLVHLEISFFAGRRGDAYGRPSKSESKTSGHPATFVA